jgi:hypothetical protein
VPVDVPHLSTVFLPCENGSTSGKRGLLHDIHIPYDYNEVF